jgi:cell division protein FtsB
LSPAPPAIPHAPHRGSLSQSLLTEINNERRPQENGQLVAEVQALRRELAALRTRAGSRLGATAAEAAAEEAGAALRAENQALQAAMAALRAELALRRAPGLPAPVCGFQGLPRTASPFCRILAAHPCQTPTLHVPY